MQALAEEDRNVRGVERCIRESVVQGLRHVSSADRKGTSHVSVLLRPGKVSPSRCGQAEWLRLGAKERRQPHQTPWYQVCLLLRGLKGRSMRERCADQKAAT